MCCVSNRTTSSTVARTDAAVGTAGMTIAEVAESWHRTAVRLGWTTEPCRLYGAALEELDAELRMLIGLRDGGPSSDDLEVWAEVVRALHEVHSRYAYHRAGFYAAVSGLVGPGER
jgi:ferredoxin-thioredoxin reductase catalytic subunit